MVNVLISLVDKNNNLFGNHVLQVDETFDNSGLQSFLNTLTEKKHNFRFFVENERFLTSFGNLISKKNLDVEQKIIVEYEEDENKPNEIIDMKDTVNSLIYHDNLLYVAYFYSSLDVFVKKEKLQKAEKTKIHCRNIYLHGQTILGYKKNKGLLDLRSNTIMPQIGDYDVSKLFSHNGVIYFGTNTQYCYCFSIDHTYELFKADSIVVNIYEQDGCINFMAQNGIIYTYTLSDKQVNRFKLGFCPVSFYKTSSKVLYGSAEGFIYDTSTKKRIEVGLRYIKGMLMAEEHICILYDQYNSEFFNIQTKSTINKMHFEGEIIDIEISNDVLYVAVGKNLYCYRIISLLNGFKQ